jgi:hypothetical protein
MTAPTQLPPLSSVLQTLSAAGLADLEQLWGLSPKELAVALFDLLPGLVDTWGEASAAAAADWYDELRDTQDIPGRFSAIVEPLGDLGASALAGWAAEPLKLPEPDLLSARSRLEDGFQKRLVNSANLTVTGSAAEDPNARGYMRQTRPGACKFCIMVASRPAVYTKASATFACHGHCYCEAVPAWGGKALPVKPYKPSDRPSTPEDRARVRKWIADNLSD